MGREKKVPHSPGVSKESGDGKEMNSFVLFANSSLIMPTSGVILQVHFDKSRLPSEKRGREEEKRPNVQNK